MPAIDTLGSVLRAAAVRLGAEGRADAECLLAHALGRSRAWLLAHAGDIVDAAALERFASLVARRECGEPVAYLLGVRGFWRFDLAVSPATLIPRPETERLVELALERLDRHAPQDVADLGTGSGAIALAVALERPQARVWASDISPEALAVAQANARALGLDQVRFVCGRWFAPLAGRCFDLVVSNPPYIADHDSHLDRGDLRFEPRAALASGVDGLDALREIVREASAHLKPGGCLLVEHGCDQGAAVHGLFVAAGFAGVETAHDLAGHPRVTLGRRGSA